MLEEYRKRAVALDRLLLEICQSLQLTPTQHQKAVDRYQSIARILDGPGTPFYNIESNLYPQGSMRLGTTVKPLDGPHDLDFVCEFNIPHASVNPMVLLQKMYSVFSEHGVYEGMVELKKRCVRIVYKDEFYLDVLPACRDDWNGGTCIQVPDRELRNWTPSNPLGFADWFETATMGVQVQQFSESFSSMAMDKAASVEPIPKLEATEEKAVLQLIVQLLKRWRDIHYSASKFPPISIVLTTLAAEIYQGQQLLCQSLLGVLDGIVSRLNEARRNGQRLAVCNPSHPQENFSERWEASPRAYDEFEVGIRSFAATWKEVCFGQGNPNKQLEQLFGGVVNETLIRNANKVQATRERGGLGISSVGRIAPVAASITPMLRNTNHGKK